MKEKLEVVVREFQRLGVSVQETRAYLSLLQKDNISGYQLAKNAGVPSSKIYGVIEKLMERGFIVAADTRPLKYFPQDPDKVLKGLAEEYSSSIANLTSALRHFRNEGQGNGLLAWNVPNRQDVVRKAQEIIDRAAESIYLALWPKDLKPIRASLTKAAGRGVKINTVAYGKTSFDKGTIYRHRPSDYPFRERGERRFVLVVDNKRSIIANFGDQETSGGLHTENSGLVQLFRDFVIHEIYIIMVEETYPEEIRRLVGRNWEKVRVS